MTSLHRYDGEDDTCKVEKHIKLFSKAVASYAELRTTGACVAWDKRSERLIWRGYRQTAERGEASWNERWVILACVSRVCLFRTFESDPARGVRLDVIWNCPYGCAACVVIITIEISGIGGIFKKGNFKIIVFGFLWWPLANIESHGSLWRTQGNSRPA